MDLANTILLAAELAAEHAPEVAAGGSSDVLGTLGINWKLFIAQLVNFFAILFILWRWVWKPVGGALEARRLKIEQSVAGAKKIEEQMQESDQIREQKMREARVTADEIVKKTAGEAEKSKQEILVAARADADKIMSKTKETIEAEKRQMLADVRSEIADVVVMATEKILRVKLDEKKDKDLIIRAIHEIQH